MEVAVTLFAIWIFAPMVCFGLIALFEGFPRITLGQVAGIVAVAAWVFGLFSQRWLGPYLTCTVVPLVVLFYAAWRREFRLLMLRGDDEFPGRFDKVGWFLMLTAAAPVGIWFFRSYRKDRWPEPGKAASRPRSSPWDGDEDEADEREPSLAGAGVE